MKDFLSFYFETYYYFGDRCGRVYYFLSVFIWILTFIIVSGLTATFPDNGVMVLLFYLQIFIFTLPTASSVAKRLHDFSLPGILGILLIPLFFIFSPLFILGLLVIGLIPGKKGINKYGEDPRNTNEA